MLPETVNPKPTLSMRNGESRNQQCITHTTTATKCTTQGYNFSMAKAACCWIQAFGSKRKRLFSAATEPD